MRAQQEEPLAHRARLRCQDSTRVIANATMMERQGARYCFGAGSALVVGEVPVPSRGPEDHNRVGDTAS